MERPVVPRVVGERMGRPVVLRGQRARRRLVVLRSQQARVGRPVSHVPLAFARRTSSLDSLVSGKVGAAGSIPKRLPLAPGVQNAAAHTVYRPNRRVVLRRVGERMGSPGVLSSQQARVGRPAVIVQVVSITISFFVKTVQDTVYLPKVEEPSAKT